MSTAHFWSAHSPEGRRRRMIVALFVAGIATFAQLYSTQSILPELVRDLGITPANAALSVSVSTIALAASVLPWTLLGERIGRVRAMYISAISTALLGVLTALSPELFSLLAMRALIGIALAGVPALAIAAVHDELSTGFAATTAAYIAGTSIGGASGRLISGPIAAVWGWRPALLVVGLVSLLAVVVFIVTMPSPHFRGHSIDGHIRDWRVRTGQALADPLLRVLYLQGLVVMGGFVAVYNFVSFRLEAPPFGIDPALVPLIFLAYAAGTVSSQATGRWVPRFGPQRTAVAGSLAMIAGLLIMLVPHLGVIVAGLLVFTAGFFATHATATAWIGMHANPIFRSQASALYIIAYYVGSGLLGWLLGIVFQNFGWTAITAAVIALIGLGVAAYATVKPSPNPS